MEYLDESFSDKSFDAITLGSTNTLYSNAEAELDTPETLKVSHETSKNGQTMNSVIILKDVVENDDAEPLSGSIQVMCKVTADMSVATKAQITERIARMGILLIGGLTPGVAINIPTGESVTTNFSIDKFLNGEH
jgi:hypothetical protein